MVEIAAPQHLTRSLTLTLAVLYGLGVTIGAGIYVLVGVAAGRTMSLIAVVATLNGIIVHMIMIPRVFYGLASQGNLPALLTRLDARTGTPLLATALGVAAILLLALAVPLSGLADLTARFTLVIFAIMNLALLRIKAREISPPAGVFVCPGWVPAAGLISSLGLLLLDRIVR